jgi:nitrite reductase/ring-hydroxylating ferredoxin subunit
MPTPTHDQHAPTLPAAEEAAPRRTSRRTLVGGIASGGLALPLLAACGSGSNDGNASGGSGSGASSSSGSSGSATSRSSGGKAAGALTATSAIPVGGGKVFDGAKVVVTQPKAGEFKAFSAVCTHQGCLVGKVSDGKIVCPCHGSEFSITDGSVQGGPAPRGLPAEQITVANGQIRLA